MSTSARATARQTNQRGCSVSSTARGPRLSDGADYSVPILPLLGWVRNLIGFYEAREIVGFDRFLRVQAWLDRRLARPAVQRGLK